MRKLLLLLTFIVTSLVTQAQEQQLTGCMGIQFGDSKETVLTKMKSKPEFKYYRTSTETNTISYMNGKFAGRECVGAVYHFYDNQLYSITILLDPGLKTKALSLYETVGDELFSRYGIEPVKAHKFQNPYTEGDGYTTTAISLGYADLKSYMLFPDENIICLSITNSLSVSIEYQHTSLAQSAINERNKKRTTDY